MSALVGDRAAALRTHVTQRLEAMRQDRQSWWLHWKELGDYLLPRRYKWLIIPNDARRGSQINTRIIDSTATVAWRILTAGMMAGITSPGRPWFRLTVEDPELAQWGPVKRALAESTARMATVMAESNYYSAKHTQYGDLACFGTAPMLIVEDAEDVVRCVNPAAGEYFVANNSRLRVGVFAREFVLTAAQVVEEFGAAACSDAVRQAASLASSMQREVIVGHLVEPNGLVAGGRPVPDSFPWRETYWEKGGGGDALLRVSGYHEWPCPCPRWDVVSNDAYGRSPAMDALGDIKQLQVEQKRKGQGIDKHVNPPLLADAQLKNEPASGLPGGVTYVMGLSSGFVGMKPVYEVRPELEGLVADIQDVRERINAVFFRDLFMMISQLDTVRTATEIDARREEKLIQLGPVLERFETESLDPDIDRVFGIMARRRLLPQFPPELGAGRPIRVEYVSMLAQMQRAASTAAIERLYAFVGNLAATDPTALDNTDNDEAIAEYADILGVPPKILRATAQVAQLRQARAQQAQEDRAVALTQAGVQGAKTLSETDVGGGLNALQAATGMARAA